jgi:hypothetical protein
VLSDQVRPRQVCSAIFPTSGLPNFAVVRLNRDFDTSAQDLGQFLLNCGRQRILALLHGRREGDGSGAAANKIGRIIGFCGGSSCRAVDDVSVSS